LGPEQPERPEQLLVTPFPKYMTEHDRACHGKWTIVGMRGAVGTESTAVAVAHCTPRFAEN